MEPTKVFELFNPKKVVLRKERSESDYRFLSAEIDENGDLVIDGQDLGGGVDSAFGCSEYEWSWTVRAKHIGQLKIALGSRRNILRTLKKRFSDQKAAGLYEFLQKSKVPFEGWSRIGD